MYWAVWPDCKFVRDRTYLIKASLKVAKHLVPAFNGNKNAKKAMAWAKIEQFLVLHLVNERRNYVISRLCKLYIDELTVGCGKALTAEEDEDDDEAEDGEATDGEVKTLDLSKPNKLKIRPDLPTPDLVIKMVMRDAEAWGYNPDTDEFEDEEKMSRMDELLAYWQDMVVPRVAGYKVMSETQKCYKLLSATVTPSTEAYAAFAVVNYWDRWGLRAKFGIKNPDKKIYKDKNGEFLPELKGFKCKYTSPNEGQQPYGAVSQDGLDFLTDLTKAIKQNREENADFVKDVEERVLAIVYKRHDRERIDNKGKKAPKRARTASHGQEVRLEDINLDDDSH